MGNSPYQFQFELDMHCVDALEKLESNGIAAKLSEQVIADQLRLRHILYRQKLVRVRRRIMINSVLLLISMVFGGFLVIRMDDQIPLILGAVLCLVAGFLIRESVFRYLATHKQLVELDAFAFRKGYRETLPPM